MPFAHESERHFAELLDFYGVRWEYEPVEFVLEWNEDRTPAAAFRPDFYLPDHGCFIELTTLSQKLVTRKNAKVRRLRELHEIECEIKSAELSFEEWEVLFRERITIEIAMLRAIAGVTDRPVAPCESHESALAGRELATRH